MTKLAKSTALTLSLLACAAAANLIPNGDMEQGNGGWYLWNNPDGPAEIESVVAGEGLGANGSKGALIIVKKPPNPVWGLQLQAPKWQADSAVYRLRFKAKGNGFLKAVAQGIGPDWREKESGSWELTKEWKEYTMPFLADQKGHGLNNINFQIGSIKDTVFIDDVIVEPLGTAFDTTWFSQANSRIEKNRKHDFNIKAKAGDTARIELVQHEFPFGTALALNVKQDSVEKWYRKTAAKYFWSGVNENIFKWPDYEPKKGDAKKKEMAEYVNFAKENGWSLRAHTLVWGHQGYGFDKHWSIQGSCKDLEKNIKARIDRDLKEYKGKISEYDVWNEPFHEPFLFNKCGWQILDSAFAWAHRADPNAKLYINEYNVISAGETERFYGLIKGMLDRKIPVHGIGVQCHFQTRPVIPALVKERLDKLATLGLPIKVTELDFGSEQTGLGMSEQKQAQNYKTFIATAFSHPAISGILLWGFWDNRHWIKDGGIIDAKGRAKPAADTLYNLWHKTWTTNLQSIANQSGEIRFRGFPGKYKITIANKQEFMLCKMGKSECEKQ
jgi:endo-1,4-beta-xylanase